MKALERDEILQYLRVIKPQLQKEGFVEVGLFGSFARNEAGIYSDIDVAVRRADDYLDKHSAYEYLDALKRIKGRLRQRFGRLVDVVDLSTDSMATREAQKEIIYV